VASDIHVIVDDGILRLRVMLTADVLPITDFERVAGDDELRDDESARRPMRRIANTICRRILVAARVRNGHDVCRGLKTGETRLKTRSMLASK